MIHKHESFGIQRMILSWEKSERDNLLLMVIALSFSIGNKSSIVRDFMVLLKIGPSEKFYISFLAFFQGL